MFLNIAINTITQLGLGVLALVSGLDWWALIAPFLQDAFAIQAAGWYPGGDDVAGGGAVVGNPLRLIIGIGARQRYPVPRVDPRDADRHGAVDRDRAIGVAGGRGGAYLSDGFRVAGSIPVRVFQDVTRIDLAVQHLIQPGGGVLVVVFWRAM